MSRRNAVLTLKAGDSWVDGVMKIRHEVVILFSYNLWLIVRSWTGLISKPSQERIILILLLISLILRLIWRLLFVMVIRAWCQMVSISLFLEGFDVLLGRIYVDV